MLLVVFRTDDENGWVLSAFISLLSTSAEAVQLRALEGLSVRMRFDII